MHWPLFFSRLPHLVWYGLERVTSAIQLFAETNFN